MHFSQGQPLFWDTLHQEHPSPLLPQLWFRCPHYLTLTFLSDWLICLSTRKSAPWMWALHVSELQHPVHEDVLTLGERIHYSHLVDGETEAQPPIDPRQ